MQKIAVAIVHGVGKQDPNFAGEMMAKLAHRFASELGANETISEAEVAERLVMKPVYWAPVLQKLEDALLERVKKGGQLDWMLARQLLIDYGADAVAYQPTPWDRSVYDDIHAVLASSLKELAQEAGESAPLCVIAHSLGTIITSNFFYDLQAEFAFARKILKPELKATVEKTPLERGETLALLYTLGSPIAIWSLRYKNFGIPISVPSFELSNHYPPETYPNLSGEWLNFYDKDDAIGYPLKTLNDAYATTVTEDRQINSGGLLEGWNPASHLGYWADSDCIDPIAQSLAKTFHAANP